MTASQQIKLMALRIAWKNLPWFATAEEIISYARTTEAALRNTAFCDTRRQMDEVLQ